MSFETTVAFVKQYKDNITMLSQQRGSRLRGSVLEEPLTGTSVFMDQIGPTQAQRTTSRHADSPLVSTPHSRRRISSIDVEWGDLIDDFDKLKMIINPESAYAQNAAWAIGREIDDIIFEKFFADAVTGQEGGSTVSFPADNIIDEDFDGDGTNEGLTVAKLKEARTRLKENEVDLDMETPLIAVPAKTVNQLLDDPQVTSADFNTVRALVNGEINTYMGFRFIPSERVPSKDANTKKLPVWVPSGMGLAVSQNPRAEIAPRADKRFSTYVYYSTSVGASRLEEEKVMQIEVKV
jgi:hypothetical protein